MKSYAEVEVFQKWELRAFKRATELVACVPESTIGGSELRCHELARAVMIKLVEDWALSPARRNPDELSHGLELQVIDGYYGMIEHSFIYLGRIMEGGFGAPPNVLDVYTPGRMPQVQLVSSSSTLPFYYRRGQPRTDIKMNVIDELMSIWSCEELISRWKDSKWD